MLIICHHQQISSSALHAQLLINHGILLTEEWGSSAAVSSPLLWKCPLRFQHLLLKLHCVVGSSEVKNTIDVRVFYSRDETGSWLRPDLTIELYLVKSLYYGSESCSLYTRNTSWRSVYYMILNKPLVRLTTVHYQSTVSMISFAQVLTAQWSNTIPCWNVQFQVGITSHDIPFWHPLLFHHKPLSILHRMHRDNCSPLYSANVARQFMWHSPKVNSSCFAISVEPTSFRAISSCFLPSCKSLLSQCKRIHLKYT